MKTDKDWEARARDLLDNARRGHNMERRIVGPEAARSVEAAVISAALQLGREMADERAEEIARRIEMAHWTEQPIKQEATASVCSQIARSTIRARCGECGAPEELPAAEGGITKSKTREQVLEEALRQISINAHGAMDIARRALEWTP